MLGNNEGESVSTGGAGSMVTKKVLNVVFGNFNPEYSKEDQRRMRYIQSKYAMAYAESGGDEPNTVITEQDPNSKLKLTVNGRKPANPYPDERSFEDSLQFGSNHRSGHDGRFAVSHALTSIGKLIEYQCQRKARKWVPGMQTHGRPNDYMNLFLAEMKTWLAM